MVKLIFSTSNDFVSRAVRLYTWSDWSHCGILLPNDTVIDSTLSHGGVRQRSLEAFKQEDSVWEIREYQSLSPELIEFAKQQLNKPYDITGILGMPFRRDWQRTDRWFCSELIAWSAAQAGTPMIHKDTWRVTPQDLYQVQEGFILAGSKGAS